MTAFTFGKGDEAVLQHREPVRRQQQWRACRTEAEKVVAMRDLFFEVLYGLDEWGGSLHSTEGLDTFEIDRAFSYADLYAPDAELTPALREARAWAEDLWWEVASAVDPGRLLRAPCCPTCGQVTGPPGGVTMAISAQEADALRRSR